MPGADSGAAGESARRLRRGLLLATMPGRLGALVEVCGGSNLVGIAQHSIVIDFGRFVHWSKGPGWSGNDRLSDAYLRHTHLDPAVVGHSLWDVPTLHEVHERASI